MEALDLKNKSGIAKGSTWEATLLTSFSRRKIKICLDLEKSVDVAEFVKVVKIARQLQIRRDLYTDD